jgi:glycosyltransferase involved in cell wall biosynthesis
MRRSVVLYNDAPEFGGHEVMSLQLAEALAREYAVVYYHSQPGIRERLSPGVRAVALPFSSKVGTLAVLRNLNRWHISWLTDQFAAERPDAVVVVHGAIDLSLRGAVASRRAGIRTISYLPMSFPRRLMGLHGGWFFDRYFAMHYGLFDAFLTIGRAQQAFIRTFARAGTSIEILENCLSEMRPPAHGAPATPGLLRIGVVGRLEWRQKGLSHVLDLARQLLERRQDVRFVIIGDGPDRERFERATYAGGLRPHFECVGWVSDRQSIYSSFDLLLIPSLFEGVPLVLLEALAWRKPTLARLTAGTSVFSEYLPDFFLYRDTGTAVAKLIAADELMARFHGLAGTMSDQVMERHGRSRFVSRVRQIFGEWLESPCSVRQAANYRR